MSAERGVEGSFGTEMLKDTLCRHFRFVPVTGLEVFKEILWNTNEGGTAIIRPSCLVAGGALFYVVHLMRYIFDVTADASHGVILSGISK